MGEEGNVGQEGRVEGKRDRGGEPRGSPKSEGLNIAWMPRRARGLIRGDPQWLSEDWLGHSLGAQVSESELGSTCSSFPCCLCDLE